MDWITNHEKLIIGIMVILATTAILVFCMTDEVKKIRFRKINIFINIIGLVSVIITVALFVGGVFIKLNYSIEDKRKYETVTIDNKDMVVLSTIDDKLLVAEYIVKEGKVTFITNNYMLIENSNIMITYKNFESIPNIP